MTYRFKLAVVATALSLVVTPIGFSTQVLAEAGGKGGGVGESGGKAGGAGETGGKAGGAGETGGKKNGR